MSLTLKENQTFITILADGLLHQTVEEGTEGGKWRTYKTSDGTEGKKFEKVYSEIIGKITKVNFREGEYGQQLQLEIADGEQDPVVLSMSTSSNYAEDTLKKLPNVNLEKTVKIVPFSFSDDKGKSKKGVTIYQKDDKGESIKITNYFYDSVAKVNIHGYPEPKKGKKPLSKDQWKAYFLECRLFLVEKITELLKLEEVKTEESDPIGDNW